MIDDYMTPEILKHLDAISRRKTNDPDAVQELTQECLSQMLEVNYKHIGHFLHEFRRISKNIAQNEARRQKNLNMEMETETEPPADVDGVIKQLSRPVRKIARLSYRGYNQREIAQALHISSKTLIKQRSQIKTEIEALIAL